MKSTQLLNVTVSFIVLCATMANHASFGDESNSADEAKLDSLPNSVPSPSDNPTTPAKVELGKQLFFDPRLSADNQMSCTTCHLLDKALGDGLPRAIGADNKELSRNTPTLLNVGFHKTFLWDGRATSLEEQSLGPIESPQEMNQDLDELVKELAAVPDYDRQFNEVFGRNINKQDIGKALAAFERTLVTRNSPFDRYLAGDDDALSKLAKQGLELFKGEAGCIRCHNGPLLSDGNYYRLGIGDRDRGRGAVTGQQADLFKFRTALLRDVALTGPYMHDGSRSTLFDVVEFYYRGVPTPGRDGLKLDVAPLLGRSFTEIDAIVAFLESLSGESSELTPPPLP